MKNDEDLKYDQDKKNEDSLKTQEDPKVSVTVKITTAAKVTVYKMIAHPSHQVTCSVERKLVIITRVHTILLFRN